MVVNSDGSDENRPEIGTFKLVIPGMKLLLISLVLVLVASFLHFLGIIDRKAVRRVTLIARIVLIAVRLQSLVKHRRRRNR